MILDYSPDQAVTPPLRDIIRDRLTKVGQEEGARVLLAVESGSRAWGFHSPDSDYDCRFLYVRPVDDYLALRPMRDVIERPIVDEIDLGGWDLAKALRLVARGNAIVAEWMSSPIIYEEAPGFRSGFQPLVNAWRGLYGDVAHYYGLARRQWGGFIENREEVKLKKYFYVIRPAVALHWLRVRSDEPPPMNLPALLAGVSLPERTASALTALREAKQAATEGVGSGPRIAELDDYISEQMAWGKDARSTLPRIEADGLWQDTEAYFRHFIRHAG
jgi:uncharacterized protein